MKWEIIFLDKAASTNAYLADRLNNGGKIAGLAVYTADQTHGRGQRGTVWSSEPGKNLTFSIGLTVNFLPIDKQFTLSQVCSLAARDFIVRLAGADIRVKIKWPNDIYASGKKIAGILIENSVTGKTLEASVAGFGININQTVFGIEAPNATSAMLLTGRSFDVNECLNVMLECFEFWFACLERMDFEYLNSEYASSLYRLNAPCEYLYKGEKMTLTITGVAESGELRLVKENGNGIFASLKELV